MALLCFDGLESGSGNYKPIGWNVAGVDAAGRFSRGWTVQASDAGHVLSLPSAASTLILGVAQRWSVISTTVGWLQFLGDNGATNHLNLIFNASRQIIFRRGTTALATSSQTIDLNTWYYFEVKATIADTGGTFILKVDGVEWINFTGDTKNAGTNNSIDAIRFTRTGSGASGTIDDVYVCDGVDATATQGRPNNDFLGDIKVEPLLPMGNGAQSDMVGSDGDSVDNYLLVDEPNPPNTTDYVGSAVVGARDLYDFENLSTASATVFAVQSVVYASKSDAGAASLKTAFRSSGGTVQTGAAQPLSTTWGAIAGPLRHTDADGAAWSVAKVNSHQYGVEVA